MTDTQPTATAVRAARIKLVLLLVVFLSPVILAVAVYFSGWRPFGTMVSGELVTPPRALPEVTLARSPEGSFTTREFHRKWTLVYFEPTDCAAACYQRLHMLNQVHLSLGKDAERAQRLVVALDRKSLARLRRLAVEFSGMQVVTGEPAALQPLLAAFTVATGNPAEAGGRIYLVDPLGNFMMSYPPDPDFRGLRRDLGRLMSVSMLR